MKLLRDENISCSAGNDKTSTNTPKYEGQLKFTSHRHFGFIGLIINYLTDSENIIFKWKIYHFVLFCLKANLRTYSENCQICCKCF